MKVGAILLAAGGSTRLGSPKQLLRFGGASLLRHAASAAMIDCAPVVVVLGSGADEQADELWGLSVHPVTNPDWRKGMGTSVRRGMTALDTLAPGADGVLLTLCDQPLVWAGALMKLLDAFRRADSADAMVAAAYNGTVGVPAVFGRAHFDALRTLPDDTGAKSLLMKHRASIIEVPLPEAALDIDTREQYARFLATLERRHEN